MTFRLRLVIAATVAVVIAILLAALAAYLVTENSLLASLDATLYHQVTSQQTRDNPLSAARISGDVGQVVDANGTVLYSSAPLPITSDVLAVASHQQPHYFATVSVGGHALRELVVQATYGLVQPVALQVATPLEPVNDQLGHLRLALGGVAAVGTALAVLLGWLVGRTALRPLNALTETVEEVAETTDVTRRLESGGSDELGRLRRAFNRLLAALERSRESQRLLVLDASHELRTPLTSLRTNMEVARRLEALPPQERQVLVDDVLTQMDELAKLVGDMAELSRGEVQTSPRAPLRLDLLVEECVHLATTHGRSRDIHFDTSTSESWVVGRPERLSRAVGNLLDNATKWSPDGGTVEVTCGDHTVWVRDHGPGIDPSDLPHVFDRFYRAPGARSLPGSGLGLAIVAQVAEEEGGRVSAGNAPGGGAFFGLSLPAAPAPTKTTGPGAEDRPVGERAANGAPDETDGDSEVLDAEPPHDRPSQTVGGKAWAHGPGAGDAAVGEGVADPMSERGES